MARVRGRANAIVELAVQVLPWLSDTLGEVTEYQPIPMTIRLAPVVSMALVVTPFLAPCLAVDDTRAIVTE